jgi:phage terminase large subunit-like protein
MAREGLFPIGSTPPMKAIDSKAGKRTRAEPVALRLEQGRLHFIGRHEELERQCAEFIPDSGGDSPDRMDAMVHACRHFMAAEKRTMRTASPADVLKRLQGEQEVAGYVPEDWLSRYGG